MSESVQTLKLAVCLVTDVASLDYQGPMELFGFLQPSNVLNPNLPTHVASKFILDAVYLGPTEEPIKPGSGPRVIPDRTYDSVQGGEQFDVILVPGGTGTFDEVTPPSLTSFLQRQVPKAKYVLSVCTGSWALAQAGLLNGKRATTNKSLFAHIKGVTQGQGITWVPKARWVVDGNFWTASGVTAGIDMAHAFLIHLIGEEATKRIRGIVEVSVRNEGDDEFAEFYGLV